MAVLQLTHIQAARKRYADLQTFRQPYLDRARDCSSLTIPTLIPPTEEVASERLPTPYQSVGARGVNNLASKLLLALFPPNTPFFKAVLPDSYVEELKLKIAEAQQAEDQQAVGDLAQLKTQIDAGLAKVERAVMKKGEAMAARVHLFEALKLLVVSGNCLIYITREMKLRVYRLDRYVVVRDPSGNTIEIITKDSVHPHTLPAELQEKLAGIDDKYKSDNITADTRVDIYTRVYKEDKKTWKAFSEVAGEKIPGTDATYPDNALPWIALRMTSVDGESYGRSHVEESLGDLNSLERLMRSLVEAAAIASNVIFLVSPNGVTRARELAKAETGGFVTGREEDVSALRVDKMQEFSFVGDIVSKLEERLSFAYLMNTAIQRNAERVTAEEIRFMAGELEDSLGGTYSVLSQDLQRPFVRLLMNRMEAENELPKLPDDVEITITTGLEALGRGHDLNRIRLMISDLAALGEAAMKYVNFANLIERLSTAHGVDPEGLIRSDAEIQAEQQQAMMMQMMQQGVGPAINQVGQNVKQAQAGEQQGPPQPQGPSGN